MTFFYNNVSVGMKSGTADSWLLLCCAIVAVMHFQQLLRWCHEAYEESLERFGIEPAALFPTPGQQLSADFLAPLICGDPLAIALKPAIGRHLF